MWCKEGKSQACRLLGPQSHLAVAINEAPLRLNCSLQDHLHDPYVCQQQQEHWPGQNVLGATMKAQQHRGVNPLFGSAQYRKMVFLFYDLWPKRYHVQDRIDFFAPLVLQIPSWAVHTHKDIPSRAIHVTRTDVVPLQPQQCFSTSPFGKHLFLEMPWCCPCAAFPSDAEIRDWHQLLLQQTCKLLPQHKDMLSYKLVFLPGRYY